MGRNSDLVIAVAFEQQPYHVEVCDRGLLEVLSDSEYDEPLFPLHCSHSIMKEILIGQDEL